MTPKLSGRTAIVGAGNICRTAHLPALARRGEAVAAILDPSGAALQAAGPLAPGARLIESAGLDLPAGIGQAVICSPANLHAAQVRALLEQGVHVLCEKPLALSGADARALAELAARKELVLQVGYFRRFHPAARLARTLAQSRALGALRRVSVQAGHIFNDSPPSTFDSALAGGGMTADFGVHVLDRLLHWFGPLRLENYSDDDQGARMEANAWMRFRAGAGAAEFPIAVALSRTLPLGYFARMEFETAVVTSFLNEWHNLRIDHGPAGSGCRRSGAANLGVAPPRDNIDYFGDQWAEFVARIGGAPEALTSLADAVRTTELLENCYRIRGPLELACGW